MRRCSATPRRWPSYASSTRCATAKWSMAAIILLLAAIAAMLRLHGAGKHEEEAQVPATDPLFGAQPPPSMKATRKYFIAVIGLLPYVVSRTVHSQIGVFWIATAWLATGLYIAPLLSGREPKLQKLGVDVLFWALIAIVVGSTACGWLGTLQHQGGDV